MVGGDSAHPRAAGFDIPASLIEREATGLELIMHARSRWGVPADMSLTMAQVKLADWLMSDPADLSIAIEAAGIDLGGVLAGTAKLHAEQGLVIYNLTGGLIRLRDWTNSYSAAGLPPETLPAAEGDDGAASASPAPSSPIIHGTLGARDVGKLFRCIRGEGENRYILTGQGISLALDRGSAADIVSCLANALGIELPEPRR
ncbi:hypothetical protein [Sphingomonas sp. SRS2]|uniref:hypothetical protein n=1 Tax=Sphingomonas sp. SRS2 TaxID=133190 RepID=UPI0006184CF8|nr:hypothetical protein [Sphingomonas sp. SRS2]KKC24887.1 hypothetical protein WP12_16805 [Sphingomonas sp. SRS2]